MNGAFLSFSLDLLCDKAEMHAPSGTITIGDKPP